MPGQSGCDLSLAPALKRRAGRESDTRVASGCTRLLRVSKVTIAGYNMHVKSFSESVLQLAVLPQLVNLFQ